VRPSLAVVGSLAVERGIFAAVASGLNAQLVKRQVRTLNRSGRGKGMFTTKPLRDERIDDVLSAEYARRTEDALGF
jgi:hypothetical protein